MFGFHQEQLYASKLKPSTSNPPINQLPHLDAVIVRNLNYTIGRGRKKRVILNKINLTVPEGSIYGLLGPSGCGKTTMLRCVVGRIKARDAQSQVLVFGLRPGEGQNEVPGRAVGYMPQEISIYEDFTIEETLLYFGKINRMQHSEIKKRIEFLLQFLDLPSKRRSVANLSGGQKRRVSLAAALVHSPPLLILDEPTVGVDPLLRQSIWKHLVTLTQTERISVIITTHYIEEARQANVVGLMRHGKILAENSPLELMRIHKLSNLEEVFLKLCVTDSSRRAASLAGNGSNLLPADSSSRYLNKSNQHYSRYHSKDNELASPLGHISGGLSSKDYSHRWDSLTREQRLEIMSMADRQFQAKLFTRPIEKTSTDSESSSSRQHGKSRQTKHKAPIIIHTGTNKIELNNHHHQDYDNEAVEDLSSEDGVDLDNDRNFVENVQQSPENSQVPVQDEPTERINFRQLIDHAGPGYHITPSTFGDNAQQFSALHTEDYLALQAMKWAARRSNALNLINLKLNRGTDGTRNHRQHHVDWTYETDNSLHQWWRTLMAVTWKNYIRLRRNPPVLVFQFMLPAIQVILFCLCIGGDPFDVPVAIVNDEIVPRSSQQFLDGLNRKIIRQIKYDNLTSAIDAVRKGNVWGAIHIPDKYSQNLQSRLIMGEEVNNETISNGTIRVYPDLTNLHLALALETTFRETFINFARNSLEELGYDPSLASLPIQIGQPVYGTMKKDGYLEFMAPGVVISISYVMATGLTALAFILERRDGLLERSLVSGVQTSQILLAHAINQVVVMVIQISFVLGCTFFVFEIPSRGSFFLVILLILLQGCTGMGFGLLVSAICKEENTAVMMLVGTFYTNLILAGIIWPIEAMPHWLRPLSYAQPQTLPTDTLRHILSRGWGITDSGVLLGFAVTLGWLVIFLMAAGLIFKYFR